MANDTKTLTIGTATELFADIRNAGKAFFEKNTMIYVHKYVAGTDYTVTNNLVINFDGAQEILYFNAKEILAATNTNLNGVESDYASGVGKTVTTAATNGSSLAVEIFAVIRV